MTVLRDFYERRGQSPWIDNIRRDWLEDGTLTRMVADGVRGVTSNPAIFAKAFSSTSAYDDLVAKSTERDPERVFETLAVADVRDACDVLRAVYDEADAERSAGRRRHGDGYVSLEVSPRLAHDTEGTVEAAVRLAREVDRANLMIKIPATREGLPAVTQVLEHGINVNVTLIFSVPRYAEVLEAWFAGVRSAREAGHDIGRLASVASFFVSRVDSAIDPLLPDGDPRRGHAANAQVAAAYQCYLDFVQRPDVTATLAAGAQVQRPLWASTSVKNPDYSDLLYVDPLTAPETVNTMPDNTMAATLDHGGRTDSLIADAPVRARSMALLDELPESVNLAAVTEKLESDGVAAFVASYDELLATVAAKLSSVS